MAESEIIYEGIKFYSAETAFQYKKASMNGQHEEAKKVQKMSDSYQAKRACKDIKENEEWRQKKEKVMKEILEEKFKQNINMKQKLIQTGNSKLLEGTSDKFWGSGIPIAKYKSINQKNIPGKNILGNMLSEIRKKMSKK